ncbi:MAG: hypothetical protein HC888_11700 [Candidatus Competibacteraceae bacterium]|nr:hypothetical protein [Candidatus Competibacteraceae bacterium]
MCEDREGSASIDRVQHWQNTLEDIQNNCQSTDERAACQTLIDQIRAGSGQSQPETDA